MRPGQPSDPIGEYIAALWFEVAWLQYRCRRIPRASAVDASPARRTRGDPWRGRLSTIGFGRAHVQRHERRDRGSANRSIAIDRIAHRRSDRIMAACTWVVG